MYIDHTTSLTSRVMAATALASLISAIRAFTIAVVVLGELEVTARASAGLRLGRRLVLQLLVVFVTDLLHLAAFLVPALFPVNLLTLWPAGGSRFSVARSRQRQPRTSSSAKFCSLSKRAVRRCSKPRKDTFWRGRRQGPQVRVAERERAPL